MKQSFNKSQHKNFINFFQIKNTESEIEKKLYKKSYKYIKYLQYIPGIEMVAIWNSIAMNCATPESDIDLYIIAQNNRLWTVRIYTTLLFQILWVRKTNKYHAGRFCLSFFSTMKWMNFANFSLDSDIYLYFWILYMKPILNNNNCYEHFIQANNSWADFSSYSEMLEHNKTYIQYSQEKKVIQHYIWNIIEKICKTIFLPKTLKHFENIGKPYGIIINDNLLKFHNSDIRQKIKAEFI